MIDNHSQAKYQEIDDNFLIKSFCKLIKKNKIDFISQMEQFSIYDEKIEELNDDELYKKIDNKKLVTILEGILINNEKDDKKAKVLKKQKIVFQKLWPHFVRNAINHLRIGDKREKGSLKFDFGVKNLMDYFDEFTKFEELLYGIDEFYRDHSIHVFRVYFLGEYLIRHHINGYENLEILNYPDKLNSENTTPNEMEAMWCIIALCHDLGYPLQKLDELNKKVLKILEFFGTSNFFPIKFSLPLEGTILDKFILKIISSRLTDKLKLHLQPKFYAKYSNSYEKLNHGIMSCILLMKNLVYFKETDYQVIFKEGFSMNNNKEMYLEDARQFIIRREILRAIASHDNEDIYHIKMNNFLFLLIICDELQEWNRPASYKRLLYALDAKNKEIINIKNFNSDLIDIETNLNFSSGDLERYVIKKFTKFIRLLRSGIHSETRKFEFNYVIKNIDGYEYMFNYASPAKFYTESKNENKPYPNPKCEMRDQNGNIDVNFSIKNIINFLE